MQVTTDSQPPTRLLTRIRPWLAVIVAAIIFTLIPVVGLPLFFALPLIGLALAAGSPPDYVVDAKTVARRPRNIILGMVVVLCLVATVLQPHLTLLLVLVFGLDAADLVVSLIAVAALTLPLAMADSGKLIWRSTAQPTSVDASQSHLVPDRGSDCNNLVCRSGAELCPDRRTGHRSAHPARPKSTARSPS